jgi:hypothetical protein
MDKQIIKQYQRGILTAPEARDALQAAYERGDITAEQRDAATHLLDECDQCESE